jgi:hypothetical protein
VTLGALVYKSKNDARDTYIRTLVSVYVGHAWFVVTHSCKSAPVLEAGADLSDTDVAAAQEWSASMGLHGGFLVGLITEALNHRWFEYHCDEKQADVVAPDLVKIDNRLSTYLWTQEC